MTDNTDLDRLFAEMAERMADARIKGIDDNGTPYSSNKPTIIGIGRAGRAFGVVLNNKPQ